MAVYSYAEQFERQLAQKWEREMVVLIITSTYSEVH